MGSQRVNRYIKLNGRIDRAGVRNLQRLRNKPILDIQTGFLHHAVRFPLEIKRKWLDFSSHTDVPDCPQIGLLFESDTYIKPGIRIEISIMLPNKTEKFTGQVVLVKHNSDHFEIGLWLNQRDDASRARIIEQCCHIESYLQEKKYQDGPYNLNPDKVAEEWIAKYANTVPSL
jgi:hypothetical protein